MQPGEEVQDGRRPAFALHYVNREGDIEGMHVRFDGTLEEPFLLPMWPMGDEPDINTMVVSVVTESEDTPEGLKLSYNMISDVSFPEGTSYEIAEVLQSGDLENLGPIITSAQRYRNRMH